MSLRSPLCKTFAKQEREQTRLNHRKCLLNKKAGDRARTGNIQLGRLTLYQLSYARSVAAYCSITPQMIAKPRILLRM